MSDRLNDAGSQPLADVERRAILAGVAGVAAGALLTRGAGAGPLNPPPGPITSTGKTLTEVEPRTALSEANTPGGAGHVFRITQPGSYYLTGHVTGESGKGGISIEASDVTIDLMGFTLAGVPGSLYGIRTSGTRNNIRICNGAVTNWGSAGISLTIGGFGEHAIIEDIAAVANGIEGIRASRNAVVRACRAGGNGASGISCSMNAVISDCQSRDNVGSGIVAGAGSSISRCSALINSGLGIYLTGGGGVISECAAEGNANNGIETGDDAAIQRCTTRFNVQNGIKAGNGCTIIACTSGINNLSEDGSGAGIRTGDACTISESTSIGANLATRGIYTGEGCAVTNCNARSNGVGIEIGRNSVVTAASVSSNSTGIQTSVLGGCVVTACSVSGNTARGIYARSGATVQDCICAGNGTGILAEGRILVKGCTLSSNTGTGILVSSSGSRIESNNCTANATGIQLAFAGSIMLRNTCSANSTNYIIAGGNTAGPIVTSADIAINSNPHANYIF